jgi:hypothetical protein
MVELETRGEMTRRQVADFLREFADELDDGPGGHRGTEHREGTDYDAGFEEDRSPRDEVSEGPSRDEPTAVDRAAAGVDNDAEDETHRGEPKRVTFIVGGDSATVTLPDTVEFDVEIGSRSPMLGSGVNQEIEFELAWEIDDPDVAHDDPIEIE